MTNFKIKFNTRSLLFLVFFVLAILTIVLKPYWQIGGDGFGYYSYIRSFIFDGDFNLHNEFALYDSLYDHTTLIGWYTDANQIGNPFAVGSAILWAPFVWLAFIFSSFIDFFDPYFLSGFNWPYQAAVAFATWAYFLLGLALVFKTISKLLDNKVAWFGSIITVGLTPVVYYLIYEPSMAHGLTVFSSALFFYYLLNIYKTEKVSYRDFFFFAISISLLFLIRWQDIIFLLSAIILISYKIFKEKSFRNYIKPILFSAFVCFVFILPQLFMWKHLFGTWIAVPQGSSFFNLSNPHLWLFLFSSYHGMFIIHPMIILSLFGLFYLFRRYPVLVISLFVVLFIQVYLNAGLHDWYGGGSFGARRMVSSFFIFALGFSALLKNIFSRKIMLIFFSLVVFTGMFFNVLLMMAYAKGFIPLNLPTSYSDIYSAPIKVLKDL